MPTNTARADMAIDALTIGTDYDVEEENNVKTYIGDLIANLKHLCRRESIDFDSCLRSAESHFSAECDDESLAAEGQKIIEKAIAAKRADESTYDDDNGDVMPASDEEILGEVPVSLPEHVRRGTISTGDMAEGCGEVEKAASRTELVERIVCFKIAASVQIDPELSHDIAIDRAVGKILDNPAQHISMDNVDEVCDGDWKPLGEDGNPLPKPMAYVVLSREGKQGNVSVKLVTLDEHAALRQVERIIKAVGRLAGPDEEAMKIEGIPYSIHDSYNEVIAWIDSADMPIPF